MALGKNIARIRKNRGLTQAELAKRCECATITIRQYESGKREPSFDMLKFIAGALNVSAYDLLDQEEAQAALTIVSIMEMEHILLDAFSNLDKARVQFADMDPKEVNRACWNTFSNSVSFLERSLRMFLNSLPHGGSVKLCFRRDIMLNEVGLEKVYSCYCGLLSDDSGEFVTGIGDSDLKNDYPF